MEFEKKIQAFDDINFAPAKAKIEFMQAVLLFSFFSCAENKLSTPVVARILGRAASTVRRWQKGEEEKKVSPQWEKAKEEFWDKQDETEKEAYVEELKYRGAVRLLVHESDLEQMHQLLLFLTRNETLPISAGADADVEIINRIAKAAGDVKLPVDKFLSRLRKSWQREEM